MKKQTPIMDAIEFVKAIVRPFIICSAWFVWLMLIATGEEVPALLAGIAVAITVEYVGERAVKRLREK